MVEGAQAELVVGEEEDIRAAVEADLVVEVAPLAEAAKAGLAAAAALVAPVAPVLGTGEELAEAAVGPPAEA